MNVASSISGGQLLTSGANVIGSLNSLITALQSGTPHKSARQPLQFPTRLNHVSQQRIPLDNTMGQLNDQESYLGQETLTLTTPTDLAGGSQSSRCSYKPLSGRASQQCGAGGGCQSRSSNPSRLFEIDCSGESRVSN
jgi:hypothetical protein